MLQEIISGNGQDFVVYPGSSSVFLAGGALNQFYVRCKDQRRAAQVGRFAKIYQSVGGDVDRTSRRPSFIRKRTPFLLKTGWLPRLAASSGAITSVRRQHQALCRPRDISEDIPSELPERGGPTRQIGLPAWRRPGDRISERRREGAADMPNLFALMSMGPIIQSLQSKADRHVNSGAHRGSSRTASTHRGHAARASKGPGCAAT